MSCTCTLLVEFGCVLVVGLEQEMPEGASWMLEHSFRSALSGC
jgi:hypothetical protein